MIVAEYKDVLDDVDDVALVKIRCAYSAYKDYEKIAQFYSGIDEDGKVYALIGKVSGYISLYSNGENIDELKEFLSFVGYSGIFTSAQTAKALNLKVNEKCLSFKINPPYEKIENGEAGTARQLMNCLKQGLEIDDDDGFIADVTFRVNHSCAEYVLKDGAGALLYHTEKQGLVNGIATPKNMRSRGLGSAVLKMLLSRAGQRQVYACCVPKNKDFYLKNGFTYIGESAYCEEE